MSLWVALPSALGAALAYGAATAVQHREAHAGPRGSGTPSPDGAASGTAPTAKPAARSATEPRADAGRLLALLTNPRWVLSVGGDAIGLLLQVVALATGPVVLIQPLLVLALPVALPVGWALGGPRPRRADLVSCVLIIGALAAFFALTPDPGAGRSLGLGAAVGLLAAAVVVMVMVISGVRHRPARARAVCFGALAGAAFGVVGVLINAVTSGIDALGLRHLTDPAGWVPLLGVLAIGAGGVVLTQVSFQLGDLGASFPASESAAPVVAVVLGAALLGERVVVSVPHVLAYAACLAAIVTGTARLARPRDDGAGNPDGERGPARPGPTGG